MANQSSPDVRGWEARREGAVDCERCGGLMVAERFSGGDSMLSAWQYDGLRCVNCGAILLDRDREHRSRFVWVRLSERVKNLR